MGYEIPSAPPVRWQRGHYSSFVTLAELNVYPTFTLSLPNPLIFFKQQQNTAGYKKSASCQAAAFAQLRTIALTRAPSVDRTPQILTIVMITSACPLDGSVCP